MKDSKYLGSLKGQMEAAIKMQQKFEQMHSENVKKYRSALLEFTRLHKILRESLQEAEVKITSISERFNAATNDYEEFERQFYKYTAELAKTSPVCQQIFDSLQIKEDTCLDRIFAQEAARVERRKSVTSKLKTDLAKKMLDIKSEFNNQFDSTIKHGLVSEELVAHFKNKEQEFAQCYADFVKLKIEVLEAMSEDLDPYTNDQWKLKFENWDKSLKSYLNEMTLKRQTYEKKCLLEKPIGEMKNNNYLEHFNDSKCNDFSATLGKHFFHTPALDDMVSPLKEDSTLSSSDVVGDNLTQTVDQSSINEDLQVLDDWVSSLTPNPNFEENSFKPPMPINQVGLPNAYQRIGVLPTSTLQPPVLPSSSHWGVNHNLNDLNEIGTPKEPALVQQQMNRPYGAFYSFTYEGKTLNKPIKLENLEKKITEDKFPCQLCINREFKNKEDLRAHEKREHHQRLFFKCPLAACGYLSASKHEKAQHYLSHVTEEEKKNVCKICFTVQNHSLLQHMKANHYIKTWDDMESEYCAFCYKKCSKNNLLTHMSTHQNQKIVAESQVNAPSGRFHCHVCNKSFIHNKVLAIHLLMSHNTPPYTCNICRAVFYTKAKYDFHKNHHTRLEEMLAHKHKNKLSKS